MIVIVSIIVFENQFTRICVRVFCREDMERMCVEWRKNREKRYIELDILLF
jgi:hypothetical protein